MKFEPLYQDEVSAESAILSDGYSSFANSALACFKMGMPLSASFQSVRKSSYAVFALILSPDKVDARPSCKRASAPMSDGTHINTTCEAALAVLAAA